MLPTKVDKTNFVSFFLLSCHGPVSPGRIALHCSRPKRPLLVPVYLCHTIPKDAAAAATAPPPENQKIIMS
jgi:hypothetical protein